MQGASSTDGSTRRPLSPALAAAAAGAQGATCPTESKGSTSWEPTSICSNAWPWPEFRWPTRTGTTASHARAASPDLVTVSVRAASCGPSRSVRRTEPKPGGASPRAGTASDIQRGLRIAGPHRDLQRRARGAVARVLVHLPAHAQRLKRHRYLVVTHRDKRLFISLMNLHTIRISQLRRDEQERRALQAGIERAATAQVERRLNYSGFSSVADIRSSGKSL